MKLIKPQKNHIQELMSWFPTQDLLSSWSGPNFRFPFDDESFSEDLGLDRLSSHVLLSKKSEFLAFGQFYNRLGRCHLGRLVVNPQLRGRGIASELMRQLCVLGTEQLKVRECSLFVLAHNFSAINAYQKFGFCQSKYPEKIQLDNCLYMIKSAA